MTTPDLVAAAMTPGEALEHLLDVVSDIDENHEMLGLHHDNRHGEALARADALRDMVRAGEGRSLPATDHDAAVLDRADAWESSGETMMTPSEALAVYIREARNNRRGSTHYPGCEADHDYCQAFAMEQQLRDMVRAWEGLEAMDGEFVAPVTKLSTVPKGLSHVWQLKHWHMMGIPRLIQEEAPTPWAAVLAAMEAEE